MRPRAGFPAPIIKGTDVGHGELPPNAAPRGRAPHAAPKAVLPVQPKNAPARPSALNKITAKIKKKPRPTIPAAKKVSNAGVPRRPPRPRS